MNGNSINHGLMKNIHTITTTRCVIIQKSAVLIHFEVEAGNHAITVQLAPHPYTKQTGLIFKGLTLFYKNSAIFNTVTTKMLI